MRMLIVGGTAFTGPHIVRRLCELGHEIAVFNRGQAEADLPDAVRRIYGDRDQLQDAAGELCAFAPEVVLDTVLTTEPQAQTVMRTFKGVARRIVAISSQDVYRAYGRLIHLEPGPVEPVPIDEDAPLRAKLYPYREQAEGPEHRFYHYEKIVVERAIMGDPNLPGTILRWPMVYGPRDRQHRTFEYLKRMDDGRPAILLEESAAKWQWTKGYVENVAAAVVLALTDERAAGRIYNVGERDTQTWAEWVRAIGRAAGWGGEVVVVPRERLPESMLPVHNTDQHLVTDTTRIREELGYKEVVTCEEGLRRTVAWERANPPEQFDPKQFDYQAEDKVLADLNP
jgi:nucleoside-diphosphate-sugar epimerase